MKHLGALCSLLLFLSAPCLAQNDQNPPASQPPASSSQTPSTSSSSSSSSSKAQEPETPPAPAQVREMTPFEISGGYSLRVFTQPNYARIGLNGAYASLDYNIFNRLGAAIELNGGLRNQGINGDLSIFSVLVGPQLYPFTHRHKLTPFVHILLGEAFYRNDYPAYGGFPHTIVTSSGFSWEGGGGIDWFYRPHWEFRLIQLDFSQTRFLGNLSQTNYRGSIGIVYRFGEKK